MSRKWTPIGIFSETAWIGAETEIINGAAYAGSLNAASIPKKVRLRTWILLKSGVIGITGPENGGQGNWPDGVSGK
jgi:hypothetical protein